MSESFITALTAFLREALGTDRIHPSVLPDPAVLPALVYRVISNAGAIAHDGPVSLRNPRLQIDAWATTALEAEALELAVVNALHGYRGPMGNVDYTAAWRLEDSTQIYETETQFHRVSMDFRGWYDAAN